MLNILFPTDFTAASFPLVASAIKKSNQKINVILFHAFSLPSSPHDLLTSNYKKPEYTLMSESFRLACKQLKETYPQIINKINVSCMQGNSKALFRNFIDAKDIDFICCPEGYHYVSIQHQSINPISLFKNAGIPMIKEMATTETYSFNKTIIVSSKTVAA